MVSCFLVNGKLFLENGKPFLDKSLSQISCGFYNMLDEATPVRNILPNVKTYCHFMKMTY